MRTRKLAGFFTLFAFVSVSAATLSFSMDVWNMPPKADAQQRQVWEEEVKGFNVFYPSIEVRGIPREYKPQEFVSAMASGKGPDVARIPVAAIPLMARYGFLADLSGYTDKWTQKDYMPEIMWKAVVVDSGIYGIPYDSYFTTLFYRKDIFEKCGLERPPETWQEIVSYSRIIKSKMKGTWGIALQPDMFNFMDFIWQAGGDFYENGRVKLSGPAVIKALKFWHDLKWKYGATPPQDITYAYDVEQLFSAGKVAMMIGVANRLPVMARRFGLDLNKVEIVPLPSGDTGIKAWHAGGDAFIINSGADEESRKQAWEYIKYVLSPLNQLWKWKRMQELGMVIFPGDFSCSTNLINMPEFAKVKGLLSFAHPEPTFSQWPMIKEDFGRYVLERVFTREQVDYEAVLEEFRERTGREYHE
ncbi:MAG TPA: sugar ABC transporter substrate-binding protein [Candidatus Goldiibacteriota bacterium]|nr:sugar ABC transporter substrate-binding protein [Candidatus Goldiibacteriota bacterium]